MIVLDTHAWLWWLVAPERLSDKAAQLIDEASEILIPTIACFEVATLETRGRIRLARPLRDWITQALAHPRVASVPLSEGIAVTAATLDREQFPGDPADRIIYATARQMGATLISADRAIRAFDGVRVAW